MATPANKPPPPDSFTIPGQKWLRSLLEAQLYPDEEAALRALIGWVCQHMLAAHRIDLPLSPLLAPAPHDGWDYPALVAWESLPPTLPGDLYAALLSGRRQSGRYYTPARLAREVASLTLGPLLSAGLTPAVLDPAMGSGHFLLAAADGIATALCGRSPRLPLSEARLRALGCVYGIENDEAAAALARVTLSLWSGQPFPSAEQHLLFGDALLDDHVWESLPPRFDAVVGNPPFASVFTRARLRPPSEQAALRQRYRTAKGSFDLAVPFVERAVMACAPGGRVGLVLPNKLLSASYAAPLRRWVAARARIDTLIDYSQQMLFRASVYPVVCILRLDADPPRPECSALPWSVLISPDWPELAGCLAHTTPLGELARLSAGLSVNEAYALRTAICEDDTAQGLPTGYFRLLTSGVISPYRSQWGNKPTRFLRDRYRRPLVPAAALRPERAAQAARDKVVISGMGRQIRAVIDPGGGLASVATVIVTESRWPLPALCALLNSRLASRLYRALFGGLALRGGTLRYGKRELAALPVPALEPTDPRLARLARLGMHLHAGPNPQALEHAEALVSSLYGVLHQVAGR